VEFYVHVYASLLVVGGMLFQNLIGKSDQLVVYAYRLRNIVKQNYRTTKKKVLIMVFCFAQVQTLFVRQ
jgi:hypothetical protein